VAERPLLLNHVEMVYRPGEAEHARAFFETMGFTVTKSTAWLRIRINPEGNGVDNVMFANEATPAQQNFDTAFERALASDSRLAETLDRHRKVAREWPYYNFHFGTSIPTHGDWERRVERLQHASVNHPLLEDRVELVVFEADTPRALTKHSQAFVFTDILTTTGPFTQGLQFELQWTPVPASEAFAPRRVGSMRSDNPFPEMATLV
jgi:hypothetical protein